MERPYADGTRTLSLVVDLLHGLHAAGVPYCHWKSNEHLRESLLGFTDLDVLVDRRSYAELCTVLDPLGFKRFDSVPGKGYPGVEDFLAPDPETGRLVHLHLHNRLTLGEKHLKGYRLPWEHELLSTRRWDAEGGAFVADPHLEFLLLLVRSSLKLRFRDRILGLTGKPVMDADTLREYRWLLGRIDEATVLALSERLLGEATAGPLAALLAAEPTFARLKAFDRHARPMLGWARSYGPVGARVRRWLREAYWAATGAAKLLVRRTTPTTRTDPRGGVLIVMMGCDGSGKSTMLREVQGWLTKKLDVATIYFGSGDGPSTLLRWPFKIAVGLATKTAFYRNYRERKASSAQARGSRPQAPEAPWYEEAFRVAYALVLSREKRVRLRRAARARNLGMIVVCDRYPQNQVMGFNDGPLLSHLLDHRSALLRALARWEAVPYRAAEASPPDLVIKLHVTPEIALKRKPDMDLPEVLRRIEAVKALIYAPSCHVADIDADAPLGAVLSRVKQSVWQEL
jgi:hypothetical protein